jgi:hypothetical protein
VVLLNDSFMELLGIAHYELFYTFPPSTFIRYQEFFKDRLMLCRILPL